MFDAFIMFDHWSPHSSAITSKLSWFPKLRSEEWEKKIKLTQTRILRISRISVSWLKVNLRISNSWDFITGLLCEAKKTSEMDINIL